MWELKFFRVKGFNLRWVTAMRRMASFKMAFTNLIQPYRVLFPGRFGNHGKQ
jgi:hypothetical protein